jgi:flavorubredoxin
MFPYVADGLKSDTLLHAAISSTGTQSSGVDISDYVGDIEVIADVRSGGTNAMAIAIEHSTDNSNWVAVTGDAIYTIDATTKQKTTNATFNSVTAGGGKQKRYLRRDLLRKYVRMSVTGTSLSQNIYSELRGFKANS